MKKRCTRSQIILTTTVIALLVSGSTLFAAKGGGKGKPGGGEDPPQDLSQVQYRIKFIQLPANATETRILYIYEINNWGQVIGKYQAEDGPRNFLYDPLDSADRALDLTEIAAASLSAILPAGWRLRGALDINDWMVVVGNIEEASSGQVRPFALDLASENRVVDLLPDVTGIDTHAFQINENGDILGVFEPADRIWETWIFNPGLYGDPSLYPHPGTGSDTVAA